MSTPVTTPPVTTPTTPPVTTPTTPTTAPTTPVPPPVTTPTTPAPPPADTTSVITAPTTIPTSTTVITIVTPPPSQNTPVPTPTPTQTPTIGNTLSTSRTSSTSRTALPTATSQGSSSKGLPPGGVIAIAVVIPIVVVAALIIFGIFFWRRRSQKKSDEEDRRKEMEAYGYNPNDDPSLRPIGTLKDEGMVQDGAGYRGWGAAGAVGSAGRKTSTNTSSLPGDYSGGASWNGPSSPTHNPYATELPTDQPVSGHHRNGTMDSDVLGSGLGGGAMAGGAFAGGAAAGGLARAPSNASSTYSAGERERASHEMPAPYHEPQYQDDNAYYAAGPYDNPYAGQPQNGGGQPIMRDSPARRLTQINEGGAQPQQGGIARNF